MTIVNGYTIKPKANLGGANLRGANLRGADLDFSALPLNCGSFDVVVDTKFVWQIMAHLHRFDTRYVSTKAKRALRAIEPYGNEFCRYRKDVEPIKKKREIEK